MNRYMCVRDLQGGDFAVGSVGTAYGWLERATGWRDSDIENVVEIIYNAIKYGEGV